MSVDPLKKRYIYRLAASLVSMASNVVVQAVVPRTLGPAVYGDYSFLTNFFGRLLGFSNMGSAVGFYAKLSQRPQERKLVTFYNYFIFSIVILMGFILAASSIFSIERFIWPDQQWIFICAALIWAIVTWYSEIVNKMADAHALTIQAEKARVWQKVVAVGLILSLFFMGQLTLSSFFIYQYIILSFLCISWIRILKKSGFSPWDSWEITWADIKAYSREFYDYTHPLVVYSVFSLVVGVFDRWLLQKYAGSVEQGFFGFSYQIGAVCFVFAGAMTPLIMREFSVAFSKKNLEEMAFLFRRYIPLLFSTVAFIACFVAVEAKRVIILFGGSRYTDAFLAVTIMSFYPIHQTYGQLSGSLFYATEQTSLYRNIGIFVLSLGIPVTYFLVAPSRLGGLNAGATGLAIKMVAIQFVAVNIQLYFNTQFLKLSLVKYFLHQIISVGVLITIAIFAHFIVSSLSGGEPNTLISFLLDGFFYTLLVAGLVYCLPSVFGLKRQDIQLLLIGALRTFVSQIRKVH